MNLFIFLFLLKLITINSECINNQNNCEICHPLNDICLKCISDNYFPEENGGCEPKCTLGKNFCYKCSEDLSICLTCEQGYFPDKIGGCAFVPNCYSSYKGKCLQCEEDYILIGEENTFQICKSLNTEDLKHCKIINKINGLCDQCEEGFYLNEGDLKCGPIEHCYEAVYDVCSLCVEGYYLNKQENKCIKNYEDFIYCKETVDGKNCDSCLSRYFLAEDGKCTDTLMCMETKNGKCTKCVDKFYLSEDNCCTTEEKCQYGDGVTALCNYCYSGYYLDNKDKKCKIQENEEFEHCEIYEGGCIECEPGYYIGGDLKCSKIENCQESQDGKCIECKEGFYLGKDNRCSSVEHCIYSGGLFECEECEDGYYYSMHNKTCVKSGGNFENCKISVFVENQCSLCKDNYYLNKTDYLCYDNTGINNDFYKCEFTDYNGEKCDKCKIGYYLTSGDGKCITVSQCKYSKNENECNVCNEAYCLDVKNNKCVENDYLQDGKENIFIACNRTNEMGDKCELCLDGYEPNENGYCVDVERCEEKENDICIKCKDDNLDEGIYYCANKIYGCLKTIVMGCQQCNDLKNLYTCTQCREGFYINDERKCNRE